MPAPRTSRGSPRAAPVMAGSHGVPRPLFAVLAALLLAAPLVLAGPGGRIARR